jgi:hypothetical protein
MSEQKMGSLIFYRLSRVLLFRSAGETPIPHITRVAMEVIVAALIVASTFQSKILYTLRKKLSKSS